MVPETLPLESGWLNCVCFNTMAEILHTHQKVENNV